MGIDINNVHNIANAWASGERNAANRGKCVNQKGWVTKEQMRKDAAQKTIAILVIIFAAKLLFKLLVFLGKLSLKTFGPKWGWVVNIVGLALLIIIPACTMKMAEAKREAAAAEASEQSRIQRENYEKQKNAEIEAYRSEVREKVNSLEDRCKKEGMPFEEVVQVYEKNSKVTWNSGMTDSYAKGEIDRAFKSCEEAIDKHYNDKIWKVEEYINKKVSELNSKITPDVYVHVAHFKNKMGDKERGGYHVLNYKVSYEKIKKQIDSEFQICVNEIRSANGFRNGADAPLTVSDTAQDTQSEKEKAEEDDDEESPSFGFVLEEKETGAVDAQKTDAPKESRVDENQTKVSIEKLKAKQTDARFQIMHQWKNTYGEFGKEQLAVVLKNFDARTKLDATEDIDEEEEVKRIESATQNAIREINAYQSKAIEEYKNEASERVKKCADEFLSKLNPHASAVDPASGMRTHIEYARDHIGPQGIVCFGMSYRQAKSKLDKAANDAIERINSIVSKANSKARVDQYIKERETALTRLAKQDIQRRGDYYVEMFRRKMIHKSIGGIVDYDAPFDSVKRKIDDAYLEAEQKINAASGK